MSYIFQIFISYFQTCNAQPMWCQITFQTSLKHLKMNFISKTLFKMIFRFSRSTGRSTGPVHGKCTIGSLCTCACARLSDDPTNLAVDRLSEFWSTQVSVEIGQPGGRPSSNDYFWFQTTGRPKSCNSYNNGQFLNSETFNFCSNGYICSFQV